MERIGWIGTGIMGASMCRHLLDAGYPVTLYNRTKSKAEELIAAGASYAETPRSVAEASDTVFTMLGYPADVREVYFGRNGLFDGVASGHCLVDMTTSEPSLAQEIAARAAGLGASALDAPVSGGDSGARGGTLAIMVGGEQQAFDTVRPAFDIMGGNVRLMGPAGAGQHTKMCNQTLVASNMIGVVESLLYAYKAGLDPEEVISVIGKGAASSWAINNIGPKIVAGDYAPGFYIKHFVKDMGIALDEAQRMGVALPGLAQVRQFYVAATAHGEGDLGTQGLYRVLARLSAM